MTLFIGGSQDGSEHDISDKKPIISFALPPAMNDFLSGSEPHDVTTVSYEHYVRNELVEHELGNTYTVYTLENVSAIGMLIKNYRPNKQDRAK